MIQYSMIIDDDSGVTVEIQRISKLLFGNQDRLLVASTIARAEPGSMYEKALAELAEISENRVGAQLSRFVEAGLLIRLPKVGAERRVYYERRESSFWSLCADLLDEILALTRAR
jgi:DNA-binding MarR family transcriptional regulator